MKKVYVVRGSEDGVLGVTSNVKAAYRMACEYMTEEDVQYTSYQAICKGLKTYNYMPIHDGYGVNSYIELHLLESK